MDPTKRAKAENEAQTRLHKLITLVGEFGEDKIEVHLRKLVGELLKTEEIEFAVGTLSRSAALLAHKPAIYASLLGMLHAEGSALVAKVLASTKDSLSAYITASNLTGTRNILHFYGQLTRSKVIGTSRLVQFLARSIESSVDFWISVAAFVLNTCADSLSQDEDFEALWLAVEQNVPRSKLSVLSWTKSASIDSVDLLWRGLQGLKGSGWTCGPVYFQSDSTDLVDYSLDVTEAVPFHLPSPVPEILPVSLPIQDHTALYTIVVDVLNSFRDSAELAVEKLIGLYSAYDPNEVIVNAIFGELIRLPQPAQPVAYYASLLVRLTNATAAENTYLHLVSRAGAEVVNRAADLDLEVSERLSTVLGFYCSNFESSWRWDIYSELVLSEEKERFLKDWLDQYSRFAPYEKLIQDLPENLKPLIPHEPEPKLRFTEIEESVENTDCQLIIDRINSKATTQMMKTLLTSKEICNSGNFLYLIFCECLFFQGAKSYTHISTYITRYFEVLKAVPSTVILEALYEVWGDCCQRIEVVIGKLLSVGLVTPLDLTGYVAGRLKEDALNNLNKSEWRVLNVAYHGLKAEDSTGLLEFIASKLIPADFPRMACFLRQNLARVDTAFLENLESQHEGEFKAQLAQLKRVKELVI